MINIKFAETKPEFYGFTGLHLYSVKSKQVDENKEIIIDKQNRGITLYKQYGPIMSFLSNEVDLYPSINNEGRIGTYPIFGNPKHEKYLYLLPDNVGSQLLGYLDVDDVIKVKEFLIENSLNNEEGILKFQDALSVDVQDQLKMCLGNEMKSELTHYLQNMVDFFNQTAHTKSEVVIFAYG